MTKKPEEKPKTTTTSTSVPPVTETEGDPVIPGQPPDTFPSPAPPITAAEVFANKAGPTIDIISSAVDSFNKVDDDI